MIQGLQLAVFSCIQKSHFSSQNFVIICMESQNTLWTSSVCAVSMIPFNPTLTLARRFNQTVLKATNFFMEFGPQIHSECRYTDKISVTLLKIKPKPASQCLVSLHIHPSQLQTKQFIFWYLTLILDGSLATVPSQTTPLAMELSKKFVSFSSSCVPLLPDVSISM